MRLIISTLFYTVLGLFAGVQHSPEFAILGGVIFAVAGNLLSRMVVLPRGILGEGAIMDSGVEEKKVREEIGDVVAKIEELNGKDNLTEEEEKESTDLMAKGEVLAKKLKRIQEANKLKGITDINDKGVRVKENKNETKEAMYAFTADLFKGIAGNKIDKINDAQQKLAEGGHYGSRIQEKVLNAGFETLSDDGGGIFLPTMVSQQIFEYEKQYGFIPRFAQELPLPSGRMTIPNTTGELTFYAIAEGSEMKARKYALGGIVLDPHKWGVIVPWTREIEAEAGARLVENVMRKLGEASSKIKDTTFFSGDGTSTYHNIKGIATRATAGDVSVQTAASGNTTFATLDPKDYSDLQKKLPAALRMRGVYVVHPDRLYDFMAWVDTAGNYVPRNVFSMNDNGEVRVWGRPVAFTESGFNTDGVSKEAAAYVDPSFIAFGNGQNMTSERMTEATIKDVDDSTSINLGSTDQVALKVTEKWDLNFGLNEAFAILKTAAS